MDEIKTISPSYSTQIKAHWKIGLLGLLTLIYIAINIFRIGGDTFVIGLNDNLADPLALAMVYLAVRFCLQPDIRGRNQLLWAGLALGWMLATIAEFTWSIYTLAGNDVPYPSLADLFWVASYIPMIAALLIRSLSLPRTSNRWQLAGISLAILSSTGMTLAFVLIPILQSNSVELSLENILNLLYPLLDLVVLVVVLRMLFAYGQGIYGQAWAWLSAGFIIQSIANLLFSYATTAGLYYPQNHVNLISTLGIDIPYNLSYVFWLIGLLRLNAVQAGHRGIAEPDTFILFDAIPNTHILVFIDRDYKVTSVSRNYLIAFTMDSVERKSIRETLGIRSNAIERFIDKLKARKLAKETPIDITTRWGEQTGWISGVLTNDRDGNFTGATLLLRLFTKDYELDDLLTNNEKSIVVSLSGQTGSIQTENEEIKIFLTKYYLAYLKSFYNRIYTEGGSLMADAFLTELQSIARQHRWQIRIRPRGLLDLESTSLPVARQALPILFESARQYVARITDKATVETIVKQVQARLDESIPKNVLHFEKLKL